MLSDLPPDLMRAVLRASQADIDHQLACLPSSLHNDAIEVSFPSLSTHRALTLDCNELLQQTIISVLRVASELPIPLQNLSISHLSVLNPSESGSTVLVKVLADACAMPSAVSLGVECTDSVAQLHPVIGALSQNTGLTSLELTLQRVPYRAVRALEDLVPQQCSLQRLSVNVEREAGSLCPSE